MLFFFTRHGEAAHNVLINTGKKEGNLEVVKRGRALFDPSLTTRGLSQAKALAESISAHPVSLIVTSPLQRALETTELVWRHIPGTRVIVSSLHTENGMVVQGDDVAGAPCQLGKSVDEIRSTFPAAWDFSPLDDTATWCRRADYNGFFHPLQVEARIDLFSDFLRSLGDINILVIGHSGFYTRFLGGPKMANCEIIQRELSSLCKEEEAKVAGGILS